MKKEESEGKEGREKAVRKVETSDMELSVQVTNLSLFLHFSPYLHSLQLAFWSFDISGLSGSGLRAILNS